MCVVCWERPVSAVAVPCGHATSCYDCLLRVREERQSGCPLCRAGIREVLRLDDHNPD